MLGIVAASRPNYVGGLRPRGRPRVGLPPFSNVGPHSTNLLPRPTCVTARSPVGPPLRWQPIPSGRQTRLDGCHLSRARADAAASPCDGKRQKTSRDDLFFLRYQTIGPGRLLCLLAGEREGMPECDRGLGGAHARRSNHSQAADVPPRYLGLGGRQWTKQSNGRNWLLPLLTVGVGNHCIARLVLATRRQAQI